MPRYRWGSGTVWKNRGERTYQVEFSAGGKRYRISSGTTDRAEARRFLQRKLQEAQEGRLVLGADRVTFDEMMEAVLRKARERGLRAIPDTERRINKHLLRFFGGRRMTTITEGDLGRYIEHRQQQGAANASINRELAIVRRAFVLGRRRLGNYWPMDSSGERFPSLEEADPREGFFEQQEFESVLAKLPAYLRPPMTFAFFTGWRKREIFGLVWKSIDREAGTVHLAPSRSKSKKGRTIVLPAVLRAVVEQQWAEHEHLYPGCEWVFHRDGHQIRSHYAAWKTACKKAGVAGRVMHDFRRTAVRNLVRAGVTEHTAMRITGHATPEIFRRYDIQGLSDLKEAADRLDRAFGTTSTQEITQGSQPPPDNAARKQLTH